MFPVLIVGLVSLGAAASAAVRGRRETRRFALRLGNVVVAMTVVALFMNLMTVFYYLARMPSVSPTILCQGVAESLNPVVMGAGFVALTHLLAAVARRREDERVPV